MKVPINAPRYPSEFEVTAELKLGDPSERIDSGIRLFVSWQIPGCEERGIEFFIPEKELVG